LSLYRRVDDKPSDASELGPAKFLSAGVRGEVIFLVFLVALMVAIGLLIVAITDVEAPRVFALTFYIGGGVIVVGGFLSAVEKVPYWYSPAQREAAFNMSYVIRRFGMYPRV
jgi:predicted membrane channel-forming protein YqfA (hemolysin III family)